MRYFAVMLACATCSSALAGAADELKPHDGAWLQSGIREYQRLNAHESLPDPEASEARAVTSYVCAVVDTHNHLVQRANMLAAALAEGKKRRQHIDPKVLDGMAQALPLIVPLMKTGFSASLPSCERALLIVQDFLQKYPVVLDKDADTVVEKALLDAYDEAKEP
jgi:hypothetical protein